MNRLLRKQFRLFVLMIFCQQSFVSTSNAELVCMTLRDGRTVYGTVTSSESNNEWIEISSSAAGVILKSRFPASHVQSIRQLKDETQPQQQNVIQPGLFPAATREPRFDELAPQSQSFPSPAVHANSRVQSVQIVANAANWDRDLTDDGLLVFVRLLDSELLPIAKGGTVRFELYGERFEANLDEKRFVSLGRWGMTVKAKDFRNGQLMLKLPWRTIDPSRTSEFIPEGVLTLRYNVTGQGAFDATDATVPLQGDSLLRDELEMRRGIRYFPSEDLPQR